MIRNITVLLGAAGIFVFILPVFTGRILNIGNITGLAVSLAILLYGIWQRSIHAIIAQGWKSGGLYRGALVLAHLDRIVLDFCYLVFFCHAFHPTFLRY